MEEECGDPPNMGVKVRLGVTPLPDHRSDASIFMVEFVLFCLPMRHSHARLLAS